jgi:hypothetical protein
VGFAFFIAFVVFMGFAFFIAFVVFIGVVGAIKQNVMQGLENFERRGRVKHCNHVVCNLLCIFYGGVL